MAMCLRLWWFNNHANEQIAEGSDQLLRVPASGSRPAIYPAIGAGQITTRRIPEEGSRAREAVACS
jgi:hypothetical protein